MAGRKENMLQCYNKGCGQSFTENDNSENACKHHPGGPIFHDALKGWSCCKKRSTDFTEFLNIPGCTFGAHSNVKLELVQPEVQPSKESNKQGKETDIDNVIVYNTEEFEKKAQIKPLERPAVTEPKTRLKVTVGATLKQSLEKLKKETDVQENKTEANTGDADTVKVGTSCKNNSCRKSYEDEHSNVDPCIYHPGAPIFHEGMKYWTCCQRKTSDFDNFMNQEGCITGKHLWIKKEDTSKKVACRYDWHQTAQFVTISVFAKVALPEQSSVQANGVSVDIHIAFEGGKNVFDKSLVLEGIIDPSKSTVKMLGTKVELNLRKAEAGSWRHLEARSHEQSAPAAQDEQAS